MGRLCAVRLLTLCLVYIIVHSFHGNEVEAETDPTIVHRSCSRDPEAELQVCYNLYRTVTSHEVTWDAAYDWCQSESSQLTDVADQYEHGILVAMNDGSVNLGDAWVAGKRSEDAQWRFINWEPFHGYVANEGDLASYCGTYRSAGGPVFSAEPCVEDTTERYVLCQQSLDSVSSCLGLNVTDTGFCYTLVSDAVLARTKSWYDARRRCQSVHPGADLAYSGLDNSKVQNYLRTVPGACWIGLQRNPWVWLEGPSQTETSMDGFQRWTGSEGGSRNEERCLYLDLTTDASWADDRCEVKKEYFICKHESSLAGSSTRSNSGRTTSGPQMSTANGNLTEGRKEISTVVLIGLITGCAVLVALLIIIPVMAINWSRARGRHRINRGRRSTQKLKKHRISHRNKRASNTYYNVEDGDINLATVGGNATPVLPSRDYPRSHSEAATTLPPIVPRLGAAALPREWDGRSALTVDSVGIGYSASQMGPPSTVGGASYARPSAWM